MRYLSIFIVLALFTSCVRHPRENVDITELSRTILLYGSQLKHEKNLFLDDSVVYFDDTIKGIRLDFSIQPITDNLWDTRMLLVDTVEGFLEKINNNNNIVSQLDHYPFTADDLEIYINFTSFFGKYVDLQDSALATLRGGTANYFTFTAFDCTQDCFDQRREYYWQSKLFVEAYREGEKEFGVKPTALKSLFETERYLPTK